MRFLAALAVLAALAGCGEPAGPMTDQQGCERQADEDPAVKELILKGAGSEHFKLENQDRLRAAKQDARVACLRSRGVIRPGGVERQKPI